MDHSLAKELGSLNQMLGVLESLWESAKLFNLLWEASLWDRVHQIQPENERLMWQIEVKLTKPVVTGCYQTSEFCKSCYAIHSARTLLNQPLDISLLTIALGYTRP